jgi:hypothetical protein
MDDAGAGWLWQVCRRVCLADAGLEAALSLAGWLASSGQASKQAAAAAERAARTTLTTTEPKRRSLKIWVGMQAELERACVVGQVETACSTNPLGCVGYRLSAWAGLVVAVESVHGYLTCVLLVTEVLQATSRGVRRASHERASHGPAWVVEREGVRGLLGGCVQQQHMRAARPSCIAHAHEHMIDGALQPAAAAPTDSLSQQAAVP